MFPAQIQYQLSLSFYPFLFRLHCSYFVRWRRPGSQHLRPTSSSFLYSKCRPPLFLIFDSILTKPLPSVSLYCVSPFAELPSHDWTRRFFLIVQMPVFSPGWYRLPARTTATSVRSLLLSSWPALQRSISPQCFPSAGLPFFSWVLFFPSVEFLPSCVWAFSLVF